MENYRTKDLPSASYLLTQGAALDSIERSGSICWFVFQDKNRCEKLANDFWLYNARVNAKQYFEALQTLKNRIFA